MAELLGKDVWKKYPASMLKSRAITQCARDACEEALYGLHYTPEELGAEVDEDGVVVAQVVSEPAQQAPAVTVDGDGPAGRPVVRPARSPKSAPTRNGSPRRCGSSRRSGWTPAGSCGPRRSTRSRAGEVGRTPTR